MTEEQVVVGSPEVIVGSPERDIQVKAIVKLNKIDCTKNEDEETELYKMRAKLYRFHVDQEDGSMWKERGVGDVKILKNEDSGAYRVLMRRDKTLKLCLNHYLLPNMEIKAHGSNERALLWSTPSDFSDGESKPETLCIRFGKAESAADFKSKFEECIKSVTNNVITNGKEESDKLADDLSALKVKEEKDSNDNTTGVNKNTDAETKTDTTEDETNDK